MAIYFQRAPVQGIRDGEMTKVDMSVSQRTQALSEIRRRSAWRRLNPHTFFKHLYRLVVFALILKRVPQCGHGLRSNRVVRRETEIFDRKGLARQPLRFLILGLIVSQLADRNEAFGSFNAVLPRDRFANLPRGFEQRIGAVKFAKLLVHDSQRQIQTRPAPPVLYRASGLPARRDR